MPATKPGHEPRKSGRVCHDAQVLQSRARLRFWEIDQLFICPVVGMCLTIQEQRQLLKKTDLAVKKASSFELHEALMASSKDENPLSRRVDSMLQRKIGAEAEQLRQLDGRSLAACCNAACEEGTPAPALWAAATCPRLTVDLKKEIFGIMHMTMHAQSEQLMILRQKLVKRDKEISQRRQDLKVAVRQRRQQERENKALQMSQQRLKARAEAAERERDALKDELARMFEYQRVGKLEREIRALKQEKADLHSGLQNREEKLKALQEKHDRLSEELKHQQAIMRQLKDQSQGIMNQALCMDRCDETCPSYDLCQKRILIVGGMTRMEKLFRELIEGRGGKFEYHNGCLKGGRKQLEASLKRADVILCPINCNSHSACTAVKTMAKKHNKAFHMLENSSVNTVSEVLGGLGGAGQSS